uniref:Uncharacterized protein n=1 Tax=Chromera velia CCMP2878 TaxID=1169474 RepID=A0A0G4HST0_9ALVE|eukprot:Cvel_8325.t1-p1 / transcript=Cvel_8325.t1 / gene=Cvel_8325 / organism=Chromera_velia_CCMP2878 / gene_product=hypothetical protein / transcript_product=hypothetical protein / location=Cvel_scaffold457:78947-79378(+) / protein_length=144 / sequence_SO=supercontig / SO=protein_coding / is_pseudo=false
MRRSASFSDDKGSALSSSSQQQPISPAPPPVPHIRSSPQLRVPVLRVESTKGALAGRKGVDWEGVEVSRGGRKEREGNRPCQPQDTKPPSFPPPSPSPEAAEDFPSPYFLSVEAPGEEQDEERPFPPPEVFGRLHGVSRPVGFV